MNRSYLFALLCWAIPLVAGVAVFCAWLVTRHDEWMDLGVQLILGGTVVFVIGVGALVASIRKDRLEGRVSRRRLWLSSLACGGLLLSNFPVALGLTLAAIYIEARYRVVVQNDSELVWEDVQISGGGTLSEAVRLRPGEETTFDVWPMTDGMLLCRARCDTEDVTRVVEGYVTNGVGGDAIVTLRADDATTVVRVRD